MKGSIEEFLRNMEELEKNPPPAGELRFFKSYWFISRSDEGSPNIETLGETGGSDRDLEYFNKKFIKPFNNELHSSRLRKRWTNPWKVFVSLFRGRNSRKKSN